MPWNTNWWVLTSGPSSGMTSIAYHLGFLGYTVVPEAARVLINNELSKGKTLAEIRGDETEFQRRVFEMKKGIETATPYTRHMFLERAIPDSIPYYEETGADPSPVIKFAEHIVYAGVLFVEPLETFERDYCRTEDMQKALRIGERLFETYSNMGLKLGYEVTRVPKGPIEDRVKFILAHADIRPL